MSSPQRVDHGPGTAGSSTSRIAGLTAGWAALCLLGDVVCILLFSLGGHQSHEADSSQLVTLRIAWPFLVGALVGWAVVAKRSWTAYKIWPAGITVLASTFVLGMLLRLVSGRGISGGFPIVTIVVLFFLMIGWRFFVMGKLRYRR